LEEEALTYFKERFKTQTGLYEETNAKALAKQFDLARICRTPN
jgi:hypothetical protein